jgi:hypothetical protein
MKNIEIKDKDLILARYIPSAVAWADGLNFFSNDSDFQQVGTWGYSEGKKLLAHTHNKVDRNVSWTQEVLYIRSGSIRASIFDTNGCIVTELIASEGDILILLAGGHGYEILENNTKVLEVKNGPYLGAEVDRVRLQTGLI